MNKIFYRLLIILLMVFSFYYTNKIIDFLKDTDPIMKDIKKTENKYKIDSEDALIIGNSIIPGKKGKNIDYKKSYSKMKQYGAYNEGLTVLKEVKPVISIDDNYDKYIVSGNKEKRCVALVFKIYRDTNIDNVLKILEKEKVNGTFFIDGTFLENNILKLKSMKSHELEILSYNNSYDKSLFETSMSYLENVTGKGVRYCYSENDIEILNLCSKLKLHTIMPSLIIKNNLYKEIKNNIDNSMIISIDINSYNIRELSSTIGYIRGKGYKIVKLNELLKE